MLNVALRNELTELRVADRQSVLGAVERNVSAYFVRRPMAEYSYLKAEIEPTPPFRIIGWLLAILAPLGLGLLFHRMDVFGEGSGWGFAPGSLRNRRVRF